jgi:hypothetical protein
MRTTEVSLGGFNDDSFLKSLYELAGGKEAGLGIGNYSYTAYNSNGIDKLYFGDGQFYLTLKDNTYTVTEVIDEGITEEAETCHILQDGSGIDLEDRVQVGLQLLKKYMGN